MPPLPGMLLRLSTQLPLKELSETSETHFAASKQQASHIRLFASHRITQTTETPRNGHHKLQAFETRMKSCSGSTAQQHRTYRFSTPRPNDYTSIEATCKSSSTTSPHILHRSSYPIIPRNYDYYRWGSVTAQVDPAKCQCRAYRPA